MAHSTWTSERTTEVATLLRSLEKDAHARRLPPAVYEALLRLHKKISVELVIFGRMGRVWLVRRPSRKENPAEPFPGEWNGPGATLTAAESLTRALKRLVRNEAGGIVMSRPRLIGHADIKEPRRGSYIAFVYVARRIAGVAKTNRPAGFFNPRALPRPMVKHHRCVIIPMAIRRSAEV